MKKFKAYWNISKLRLNMSLNEKYIETYPIMVYMEPTSFCQLRCPACPTGLHMNLRKSAYLDESIFKKVIDQIGDYVFYLNICNWGEPLLHRHTPEMVKYAKQKNIHVGFTTNLSMPLSDEYIERLVASGLDRLGVSLDGMTEETYSRYRRGGDLNLVRDNMSRIKKAKEKLRSATPHIAWQFLVFKHNEHEIEAAKRDYSQWGADSIYFAPAIIPSDMSEVVLEPSTIPEYNFYHKDSPVAKTYKEKQKGSCSWLYGIFVLNPDGKVSPCCSVMNEKDDFGNYSADMPFHETWNSDKFRLARQLTASSNNTESIEKRLNKSFSESNSLARTDIICTKCPIPYKRNDVEGYINRIIMDLGDSIQNKPFPVKLNALLAYLVMGMPRFTKVCSRAWQIIAKR